MSHDQLPTNTSHEHEASAKSAMDVIQERFWDPMTEMLQRREQHEAYGLDVTSLNQQIQELTNLYYDLGGADLNVSSDALANATDNNRDKLNARNEKNIDAFYRNLMKHDGVEPAEITNTPAPEEVAQPAPTPVPPSERQEPVIPIKTPATSERSVKSDNESTDIVAGTPVWYRPKAIDGQSQPWSNDWKVEKILPPKDDVNPNEVAVVINETTGARETIGLNTLRRFQHLKGSAVRDTDSSEVPAPTPLVNSEYESKSKIIKIGQEVWYKPRVNKVEANGKRAETSFGWKVVDILAPVENNPNEVAKLERDGVLAFARVDVLERLNKNRAKPPVSTATEAPEAPAPTPAEKPATTPAPAEKKPTKTPEKPTTNSAGKLEEILDINDVDTYPLREKLHKDWFNEIANDSTISTAVKEHRYKLGPEDYVFIKLAEEKLHKFKDVTDPETFKWMSDVLNDTTTSPSMKKFALRTGPNGPKRDSLDTNEIKRQLAAEGIDISGIIGEQPATTLNPDMLAELESAGQLLGVNRLSAEQAAALADAGDILDVRDGTNTRAKLNIGRSVLNSAGNVSRKSYDRARDIAWKSTSWINSSSERDDTPEKTDEEKQREEKSKKIGRWSLFSIERDEKPKSKAKVQKKGKKVTKKLGKIRDRDVRKRGWL